MNMSPGYQSKGQRSRSQESQSAKTYFRAYRVKGDLVSGVSLHSIEWQASTCIHRESKKRDTILLFIRQILTDFQNSFTIRLSKKLE